MDCGRKIWFSLNGQKHGPYTEDNIKKWLSEGKLAPTTLIWFKGMATWQPLGEALDEHHLNNRQDRSDVRKHALTPPSRKTNRLLTKEKLTATSCIALLVAAAAYFVLRHKPNNILTPILTLDHLYNGEDHPPFEVKTENVGETGNLTINKNNYWNVYFGYIAGRVYFGDKTPSSDDEITYHYKSGYSYCISLIPAQIPNSSHINDMIREVKIFRDPSRAFLASIIYPDEKLTSTLNSPGKIKEISSLYSKILDPDKGVISKPDINGSTVKFYIYKNWLWRSSFSTKKASALLMGGAICAIPIIHRSGRNSSKIGGDSHLQHQAQNSPTTVEIVQAIKKAVTRDVSLRGVNLPQDTFDISDINLLALDKHMVTENIHYAAKAKMTIVITKDAKTIADEVVHSSKDPMAPIRAAQLFSALNGPVIKAGDTFSYMIDADIVSKGERYVVDDGNIKQED